MINRTGKIVWLLILSYFAVFGTIAAFRHYSFQTQAWDMGIFIQTFWNAANGNGLVNSLEEIPHTFGVHFSPWLYALMPGYIIFPSPYYLLLVQALALALGAWPLFLLARRILKEEKWALLIAASYLLYPSLHWVNLFDFHSVAFLVPLLLAAFYFSETKQWGWAGLFLLLSASTREDSILAAIFVGLYYLVKKTGDGASRWNAARKFGLAVTLLATLYFLLSIYVFMPYFGGGLLRLDRYAQFGETPAEIVKTLVINPSLLASTIFTVEKFRYALWLFLPLAFLPFFSGRAVLLLLPGLAENLLTNNASQFSGFYQYDSVLVPVIFFTVILGLKRIMEKWPQHQRAARRLLIAAIALGYLVRSPINPVFFPVGIFQSNPRIEAFRKIVNLAPKNPNISVAAQTNLVPHLANRKEIYMLGTEPRPADVVLIDGADLSFFASEELFNAYADSYINSGNYEINSLDNRYLILFRKELLKTE